MALNTLLAHTHRARLLKNCKFVFYLIEVDEENLQALKQEINALSIPENIEINPIAGDCFPLLGSLVERLRENKSRIAPAFVFVDPYGFKVSGSLLRDVIQAGRVELFINIMWRELNMAIALAKTTHESAEGIAQTLDMLFDGPEWRNRIASDDFDDRANQAVNLLREKLSAKWATYVRMLGDTRKTRYLLLHLTNHDSGRDLIKDCIWKVCPDGGFYVRKTDDPRQEVLITPKPDLAPLRNWVLQLLSERPRRWSELTEALRREIWRAPHLNAVIRDLRSEKMITAEHYTGRFGPAANPLLRVFQT